MALTVLKLIRTHQVTDTRDSAGGLPKHRSMGVMRIIEGANVSRHTHGDLKKCLKIATEYPRDGIAIATAAEVCQSPPGLTAPANVSTPTQRCGRNTPEPVCRI